MTEGTYRAPVISHNWPKASLSHDANERSLMGSKRGGEWGECIAEDSLMLSGEIGTSELCYNMQLANFTEVLNK